MVTSAARKERRQADAEVQQKRARFADTPPTKAPPTKAPPTKAPPTKAPPTVQAAPPAKTSPALPPLAPVYVVFCIHKDTGVWHAMYFEDFKFKDGHTYGNKCTEIQKSSIRICENDLRNLNKYM